MGTTDRAKQVEGAEREAEETTEGKEIRDNGEDKSDGIHGGEEAEDSIKKARRHYGYRSGH